MDDEDPLEDLRAHYIPDQDVPPTPAESSYDPRDIKAMEADYEGMLSNREQRRRGEYGEAPSYHAIPSPPPHAEVEEEELAGPAAATDASPAPRPGS